MSAYEQTRRALAISVAVTCALMFSTGQADASLGEFSLASSFSVVGEGEEKPGIENMAVDEASGDLYVYSQGAKALISKFDADGKPAEFSSLGSNTLVVNAGGGDETELAVDNSTGPDKGDIYLAGGGVRIYGPDGKALGELTQAPGIPWGELACGVAVDGTGNVYVGVYPSVVDKYTPRANPVTNSDYTSTLGGLNEICNIAASPDGSVYAATWNPSRVQPAPLVKYDPQFANGKQVLAKAGGTLAVANSPSAELFTVTNNDEVEQYDSENNLLSTFGTQSSEYHAVAINAKNGRLYAGDFRHSNVEIWQGVFIPQVLTGTATEVNPAGTASLDGSINPEGGSIDACEFEYGLSSSYGTTSPCTQTMPLTGTNTLPVSADLAGLKPNQTYHYRLVAKDEHATRLGADKTFAISVLPTVEDIAPSVSLITRDSAELTGTVNPEQVDAGYHFEYGTTEGYGNTTQTSHTGISATDTTVSQQVGELLPNTTYHYRLVANNVAGVSTGADHTFTTDAATPPTAITGGSAGVAQNAATITGTVSTDGLPTNYGFEIGASTDYGPPTGLGTAGAGLTNAAVSLALTGLLPGTTYHYRLTATSIDGTSYGADQTFTTTVFANTFAEPPAPLPFVNIPQIAFPAETKAIAKKPVKKIKKKVKKHSKARHKNMKHKKK